MFVPGVGDVAGDADAAVEALRIIEPLLPPGCVAENAERTAHEVSARMARRDHDQVSAKRTLDAQAQPDPSYA